MFGHDALNFTNISHVLMAENRVFNSTTPNYITKTIGSGVYAGQERYIVTYGDAVGALKSRGAATLSDAIADATSGERSNSTTYQIDSYWPKDEVLATDSNNTGGDESADCPSENREAGADDTVCGACLSGFTEDATGVCVADVVITDETKEGTNWLLYGGIGIAAIAGYFALK